MLPNANVPTWDDFQSRKAASAPELLEDSIPRKRSKELTIADLLMQAVALAGERRGRISQAESVREQTLLEVLQQTICRAR